jgi:hypothetical protein
MSETDFDLNKAEGSVIPENTDCVLQLKIRAGGAGGISDQGWLKRSADGNSEHVDCELTVVGGEFNGRKLWQAHTIRGSTDKHAEAGKISMRFFRALLESALNIRPDDRSEDAEKLRKVAGWADFNGLRFVAKLGVRPAEKSYPAKNVINEIITPGREGYHEPEQVVRPAPGVAATAPVAAAASAPAPATPPAGAIARPKWMQPGKTE